MDCGTCESASPLQVHVPDEVEVDLTMTEKARDMLTDAFGDDRSTPSSWACSAVDAPATCMTSKSLNPRKLPARNSTSTDSVSLSLGHPAIS